MIAIGAAAFGASAIVEVIQKLYGVANDINDFLNKHIEEMKASDNPTINRTGRVLEGAKFGFGIGCMTSIIVISVGQLLLGNSLAAVSTVATAATFSNPIAMTCAAVGAIYYGWSALSDTERDEILDKLSAGLAVGIELIKSIIRFVVDQLKSMMSSKNLEEIKKFISTGASVFGKTLGDVTHKMTDKVNDTFVLVKNKSSDAMVKTIGVASDTYRMASETGEKAADGIKGKFKSTFNRGQD